MKRILCGSLFIACTAILCLSPNSNADTFDELSWFGNTGATNLPVKDSHVSGYWWWPEEPASNTEDTELWGNRGVTYSIYSPPKPPPPPAPQQLVGPAIERSVPIFNHVLFDFDKSVVKTSGIAEIQKVVTVLNANPNDKIVVEGHTDNVNSSGDPLYNVKLGQRRADAVSKVLLDGGVNANRITAISKGDSSPAVPNSSDANRAKNRRVLLKFQIGT